MRRERPTRGQAKPGNGPAGRGPHPQLPLPLPDSQLQRATLIILRRMAIHGIRDAQASLLAMERFGLGFRRPLVLMRCLIIEIARGSRRTIRIAPCCAPGMTQDEGLLLDSITGGGEAPMLALMDAAEDDGSLANVVTLASELAHMSAFER